MAKYAVHFGTRMVFRENDGGDKLFGIIVEAEKCDGARLQLVCVDAEWGCYEIRYYPIWDEIMGDPLEIMIGSPKCYVMFGYEKYETFEKFDETHSYWSFDK